jgi:hypothetical protein
MHMSILKVMYVRRGHLQTQYTVRHNTLMPYNNVHVVSVLMLLKLLQ